jgi:hypothetical protein
VASQAFSHLWREPGSRASPSRRIDDDSCVRHAYSPRRILSQVKHPTGAGVTTAMAAICALTVNTFALGAGYSQSKLRSYSQTTWQIGESVV